MLLEAFPTPPSFVPQNLNPPPTGPPNAPLPPLPDQASVSASSALFGSRRSSKFSVASSSSSSRRDSVSSSLSSHSHSLNGQAKSLVQFPIPDHDDGSDLDPPSSPDLKALLYSTPRARSISTKSLSTFSQISAGDEHLDLYAENEISQLQRELDGSDSDDSSIDLHTPLPHLMLRHGLLSPNSRLLSQPSSSVPPSPCPSGRPGSVLSVAESVATTKSGIIKDSRNTVRRQVRHRDGKLLKGGIGLTTGLGWSDSEDEDAPSALTKRISRLNLGARKSTSSLRSTSSISSSLRPLSHSQSQSSLVHHRRSKTPSLPPTSWAQRVRSTASSASSHDSSFSLALSTPSTTSSLTFPTPGSPQDRPTTPNRDKLLPSLPNPKTGSIKRPYIKSSSTSLPARSLPSPRRRSQTLSSGSSFDSNLSEVPQLPTARAVSVGTTARAPPRQLRLPARSVSSDRLGLPVPTTPSSLRMSQQRATLRSAPTTPLKTNSFTPAGYTRTNTISHAPAGIPIPRLQPRTGTGMVYRSTPSGIPKPPPSPTPSTIGIAL